MTHNYHVLYPISPETGATDESVERVGGEVQAEEENQGAIEEEEARVVRKATDPRQPTAAEREDHEATHLPFRSWCWACVMGRRTNPAHRKLPEDDREVQEVSLDYCFVRRRNEEQVVTILLLKDRSSRALRAWVLQKKGVCLEEPTELVLEGIKDLGFQNRVLIKVDNEPAITALRDEVLRRMPNAAAPVEVPPRESQSNGSVENGVGLFKGLLRVHLIALEMKIEGQIPSHHPVGSWLVQHVASLVTKHLVGTDGRTPYERMTGKKLHEEGLEFGEKLFARRQKESDANVVLDSRWAEGIWLGRSWGGVLHNVATGPNKILRTRGIQRKPLAARWSREDIELVKVTTMGAEQVQCDGPVLVIPPRTEEERANDPPPLPP